MVKAAQHQRSISPNTTSIVPMMARDVGQLVALADVVHRLQVQEPRRADLGAVGLVGAVGHQIDAELALRRLDRGIDLARRDVEALRCKA